MADPSAIVENVKAPEGVQTFEWRDLRFHVVTQEPLIAEQIGTIRQTLPKVASVGRFADVLGIVLGRHVRIRTQRPSPDVWFEVGR